MKYEVLIESYFYGTLTYDVYDSEAEAEQVAADIGGWYVEKK